MKKILFVFASLFLTATTVFAADRTITINEAYIAVSNRLEETASPKDWYQVWVGIVPLSEYVRNIGDGLKVFSDGEIKYSHGKFHKDIKLSTGEIINLIKFELLAMTYNADLNLYLDLMTNNAVAFYFENRATQTLKRVELENYDSLLEQLMDEYYGGNLNFDGESYHTTLYCVVDGRIPDPERRWFYAGNGTFEAHAARSTAAVGETVGEKAVWWPVYGKWLAEVPPWLHIPTKQEIDYIRDGQTPFWEYMRRKHNLYERK